MITKNKNSPATLYLLNSKHINKLQQQRKSARLTFNKKKSSRSISQYQKWNGNKDNNNGPFQPLNNSNSDIKKIVLSKNQFGIQSLGIQKKLNSIIQIFNNISRQNNFTQESLKSQLKRKSQETKSGQLSLLSIKDTGDRQRQRASKSRKISHIRTESMLNQSEYQSNIEQVIGKIDRKFKLYQKVSNDWKLKFTIDQNDLLVDKVILTFKSIVSELKAHYSNQITSNLNFFEQSLTNVAKQYQIQISGLKQQLSKADNLKDSIGNLIRIFQQKHQKGVINSKIFQDIQKNGINLQEHIKSSPVYEQIKQLAQIDNNFQFDKLKKQNIYEQKEPQSNQKNISDQDVYEEEKLDYVENDSNWNNHFQNRQSIKGVLKYINNYNQNKQTKAIDSSNSQKHDKINMKIDNWKSFQTNQKVSNNNFKKILSQR